MFNGIDPVAQIIISVTIGIGVIGLVAIIFFRGLKSGKLGFVIPGKDKDCTGYLNFKVEALGTVIDIIFNSLKDLVMLNDARRLERKMIYVENQLLIIRGIKEKRFYGLMLKSGVKKDHLTSHVDAQYYIQVLNNALYYDNGEQCLKTVFRRALTAMEYGDISNISQRENAERYEDYIQSFLKSCLQKWKRFFYNNYKTEVVDDDGSYRMRKLTNEDLYNLDFDDDHVRDLEKIFRDVFDNAKVMDEQITKELEALYELRKKDIKKVLSLKPTK